MAGQQDDYILRLIDELREFVSAIIGAHDESRLDEALLAIVHAQEKLFARPAAEFRVPDINAQLDLLTQEELPQVAKTKCLAYAASLEQAGLVYAERGQPDLSAGAFELALYVTLAVASQDLPLNDEQRAAIASLLAHVPLERLQAPVRGLLEYVIGAGPELHARK